MSRPVKKKENTHGAGFSGMNGETMGFYNPALLSQKGSGWISCVSCSIASVGDICR